MKRILTIPMLALASLFSLQAQYGPAGFCTYNDDGLDGITGGIGGEVVHVTTREALEQALAGDMPRTVYLEGELTGIGLDRKKDVIEFGSNKTLVGVGSHTVLHGIGLRVHRQHNIIIRNLTIHHGSPDAIACQSSHHIWIDHCDVYSQDEAVREDWDGLIDLTVATSYVTVSYCYVHDHHKACLVNGGTQHFEDQGRCRATYHHNAFVRTDQRNPRAGYGLCHVLCNYYDQIGSYCIGGHTQARIVSEHNYFSPSANHPFRQMYAKSTTEASCAFFSDECSYRGQGIETAFEHAETGTDFVPAEWYDYAFLLQPAETIGRLHPEQTGPVEGIEHEAILWPGNGAINQPLNVKPQWSHILGHNSSRMLIGTHPDELEYAEPHELKLQPATTYYWRVESRAGRRRYLSPLYRFTTAGTQASLPQPAHGETHAKLRVATSRSEAATPAPLTWHRAAVADGYEVWLWDEAGNAVLSGSPTKDTQIVPGTLRYGEKYTWRVDAVTAGGQRIEGERWSFTSDACPIGVGRTEMEHLARSAYAYLEYEDGKRFTASNDSMTVGESGPGAMTGIFEGPAGDYLVRVAFHDEKVGQAWMGLSVNDKQIDSWVGERSHQPIVHPVAQTVHLAPGDQIRVDFVTRGRMRCRMDYIEIEPKQ